MNNLYFQIAQLRHAYTHLKAGRVKEQEAFADYLIAPIIEGLEEEQKKQPNPFEVALYKESRTKQEIIRDVERSVENLIDWLGEDNDNIYLLPIHDVKRLRELLDKDLSKKDPRPYNCRFRLQDEGKSYPRSGCQACGKNIVGGLGNKCSQVK